MDLLEDTADREVIKIKGHHKGEALVWQEWCSYKERKRHSLSLSLSISLRTQGKAVGGHSKMTAIYMPGRGALTAHWTSRLQHCEKTDFCCLSHLVCTHITLCDSCSSGLIQPLLGNSINNSILQVNMDLGKKPRKCTVTCLRSKSRQKNFQQAGWL